MPEFKRSRLEKGADDQITKSTIFLGLLSIGLLLIVVIFGLPFLVRLSIFLGEARSRSGGEVKEKILPPLPPRLVVPFEATNSAKVTIGGVAEAGVSVELLKNDVAVTKVTVSSSGDFYFKDIELNSGTNSFSAVSMSDSGGSSEMSKVVDILFDNQAPEITMFNPSESSLVVDYADFDVIGKSEKGVSVLIGGHVAMMNDDGEFKLRVQLVSGKNEIEIIARDLAGNETKKKIEIKYDI